MVMIFNTVPLTCNMCLLYRPTSESTNIQVKHEILIYFM